MNYVIKANKRVYKQQGLILTFVEVILNRNHEWVIATAEPITLESVDAAVRYINWNKIKGPACGTDHMPRIVGPRGGVYSVYSGRRLR